MYGCCSICIDCGLIGTGDGLWRIEPNPAVGDGRGPNSDGMFEEMKDGDNRCGGLSRIGVEGFDVGMKPEGGCIAMGGGPTGNHGPGY